MISMPNPPGFIVAATASGSGKTMLAAGGKLTNTKDVVGLEELLGKVIFLVTDGDAGS